MELGGAPIRVSSLDAPEVVWCARIDPCRARIRSVPLPESGRRCGDLVLHDGEPRGTRRLGQETVSVFDELALLETSPLGTWEVVVRCADARQLQALLARLTAADLTVEDWTDSIDLLCAACSLGDPHEHDWERADRAAAGWNPIRRVGVAARAEGDLRPLRRFWFWWRRGVTSVRRVL